MKKELESINKTLDAICSNVYKYYKISDDLNKSLKPIQILSENIKNIIEIANTIKATCDNLKNAHLNIPNIIEGVNDINKNLKIIFSQDYLSLTELKFLKTSNFKKRNFDSIPKNIPSNLKDLNDTTIKYFENISDFRFNTNTQNIELYGNEYTINDINNFPKIAKFNPDFSSEYIAEFISAFKTNPLGFENTPYYIDIDNYIKDPTFYTNTNNQIFYRGVENNEDTEFEEYRMRNAGYGYSPMGRFNLTGNNFLYLTDKKIGVKTELITHIKSANFHVQLTKFTNNHPHLNLFNLDSLNIDKRLKNQLLKSIDTDDTKAIKNEYILSAVLSECIKRSQSADGIKYSKESYCCYVFYDTYLFNYENLGVFDINSPIFNT